MTIDFFASRSNYWRHLAPIAEALIERQHEVHIWHMRGTNGTWGQPIMPRTRPYSGVVVVASETDLQTMTSMLLVGTTVVYVEHGSGQTYVEAATGWPGGPGMNRVDLFVCPSERVADAWHSRYPYARTVVVGAPALDRYVVDGAVRRAPASQIYITAHWRCGQNTETWPALTHHMPAIPELRRVLGENGIDLIGHAHPRDEHRMIETWRDLGMEYEPDVEVVLGSAALIIADNTSVLYEAAAIGCPVLCLNRPEYRRHVSHGGRFWSHVPGLQCDEPEDLGLKVDAALDDLLPAVELRQRAAHYAYADLDGHASERAARAIEELTND